MIVSTFQCTHIDYKTFALLTRVKDFAAQFRQMSRNSLSRTSSALYFVDEIFESAFAQWSYFILIYIFILYNNFLLWTSTKMVSQQSDFSKHVGLGLCLGLCFTRIFGWSKRGAQLKLNSIAVLHKRKFNCFLVSWLTYKKHWASLSLWFWWTRWLGISLIKSSSTACSTPTAHWAHLTSKLKHVS